MSGGMAISKTLCKILMPSEKFLKRSLTFRLLSIEKNILYNTSCTNRS